MQRTENLVTYEVCIVCVRAPVREQSTVKRCLLITAGASGSHIGNEEYNYKTLRQDVQWIYYIQTRSLYFSYMWGLLRLAPNSRTCCGTPSHAMGKL